MMSNLIPVERIESKIFLIRGQKVMLDFDLAKLYQERTKNLNKAVKRNIRRFPSDFMFQLTEEEFNILRFQFGTSNLRSQFVTSKRGGRRYLPYAFTEQGVAMLSSVLNSERAIQVNIAIMRTFARFKQMLLNNKELAIRFNQLEHKVKENSAEIKAIFSAIRKLINPPKKKIGRIGFRIGDNG